MGNTVTINMRQKKFVPTLKRVYVKKKDFCDYKHIIDSQSYISIQNLNTGEKPKSSPSEQTQKNIDLIDRADNKLNKGNITYKNEELKTVTSAVGGLENITDEEIKAIA